MNKNRYYPIVLTQVGGKQAVVFGGGAVGERKVSGLLIAGACVSVISPQINAQLQTWVDQGAIKWIDREYQAGDCKGAYLVFAATDNRSANHQIACEAEELNILCNIADATQEGNFHLPAVFRGIEFLVGVSTYGLSPTNARKMRDKIAKWIGG